MWGQRSVCMNGVLDHHAKYTHHASRWHAYFHCHPFLFVEGISPYRFTNSMHHIWQTYKTRALFLGLPTMSPIMLYHFTMQKTNRQLIPNGFSRITSSLRNHPHLCNVIIIYHYSFFMFSKLHLHMYCELVTGGTWNLGGRRVEGYTISVQCCQSRWQKYYQYAECISEPKLNRKRQVTRLAQEAV